MPMCRRVVVAAVFAIACGSAPAALRQAAPPVVFGNAHAHNDYEHARPLLDALDHGFASVEADVWLVDGALLVGHDREAIRADRTLQTLYLDPLQARVRQNGGRVFPRGPEFLLWVDIKSESKAGAAVAAEAEATYAALTAALAPYRAMVTAVSGDTVRAGAIRVIVSGNRARETMARERVRYAFYDGRLSDLELVSSPLLIPIVSDNWQDLFTWRGVGPLPDAERTRLREIVAQAHGQGRQIRFWAIPDGREGWRECLDAGVDFINTDDLTGLRAFLLSPTSR